jgi:Zn-dependent oligopeptidase
MLMWFDIVEYSWGIILLFQGDLGYLYLDLYSRKGKYPGCANFAVKGGCRISETEYQLPVC